MKIRKPISDFVGRMPIKKEPENIKKYKDLGLEYISNNLSSSQEKIHRKQTNKAIKNKLLLSSSLNYAKYELGNNIDYIKKNPKALRLRLNKQLRIFSEKYVPYFKYDIISKEPSFRHLFSKLTIEEKISYMDFVLSYADSLKERTKTDKEECYFTLLNILEKRVTEISFKKRIEQLHVKYKNNPDKIIEEVKSLIKGKYLDSFEKYNSEFKSLDLIFKVLDKKQVLLILEYVYIHGIDHILTKTLINSYLDRSANMN